VIGFSLGSHGASVLGRTYPREFSTVSLIAHSSVVLNPSTYQDVALGAADPENLESNLEIDERHIPMSEVWRYNYPLSGDRDYPMIRQLLGKNDVNDLQMWGEAALNEVNRAFEELGWGLQFFWDLRNHSGTDPEGYWGADITNVPT